MATMNMLDRGAIQRVLEASGPYLLLELLLPGGTLFAFLLFLWRRRQRVGPDALRRPGRRAWTGLARAWRSVVVSRSMVPAASNVALPA